MPNSPESIKISFVGLDSTLVNLWQQLLATDFSETKELADTDITFSGSLDEADVLVVNRTPLQTEHVVFSPVPQTLSDKNQKVISVTYYGNPPPSDSEIIILENEPNPYDAIKKAILDKLLG